MYRESEISKNTSLKFVDLKFEELVAQHETTFNFQMTDVKVGWKWNVIKALEKLFAVFNMMGVCVHRNICLNRIISIDCQCQKILFLAARLAHDSLFLDFHRCKHKQTPKFPAVVFWALLLMENLLSKLNVESNWWLKIAASETIHIACCAQRNSKNHPI